MNQGWIALHRQILEWEWFQDHNTLIVFIYCLLKCNFKDSSFRGHAVPRGSFVTGRKKMALELGLSEQQIRTALKHLISTSEITINATTQFSIITVNKFEDFQQPTNSLTNEQPTSNQQLTTIEQRNKVISNTKSTGKPEFGNSDISKFIKGVNKHLDLKLPEDGKSRRVARNALQLLTKKNRAGEIKEGREFLHDDKWKNASDFMKEYDRVKISEGYSAQSWETLYRNLKLWVANSGSLK